MSRLSRFWKQSFRPLRGRVTFLCWPKEKSPKERACDQTSAAWRSVPGLFEGTSLSHRKAAAIVAAALRVRVFSRRACSSKVKGKDKNHEKAKRGQSGLPRIPQTGSQDTVLTVW